MQAFKIKEKKMIGMKKAVIIIVIFPLVVAVVTNVWLFVILLIIYISFGILSFFMLNKLIRHTNWWNNQFIYTSQFVSNQGYREDLHRNYEIANVGSNPARFAFHYDDVLGENWSTGTQGLDMDLEILRYYHSYLREGAYVLLPIVPFSSVSGYLEKETPSKLYLSKFYKILDGLQRNCNPKFNGMSRFMRYPLLYEWKALRFLIDDVERDRRLEITDQPMSLMDMEKDALLFINGWKKEFNIKNLDGLLPEHLVKGRDKSVKMMSDLIYFLQERGYKPVIISPPMSESLSAYFNKDVKDAYIYSFVEALKELNILYLDYTSDDEFARNEYYFNALFMNLRGRKLFTRRVLSDLGLINKLRNI